MTKVYNADGRVCARWLNKIDCMSLRTMLGGKHDSDLEYLFRGNRVPGLPISLVEDRWYMDAGEDLGSFMYCTRESAMADKATLLTIIAEAL